MSGEEGNNSLQLKKGSVGLNRKATKIEFLSQENRQLREQISELEQMLKLNKEVLRIALNQESNHSQQFMKDNSFSNSNKKNESNNSNNNNKNKQQNNNDTKNIMGDQKGLNFVIEALYKENENLMRANEKLIEERNIAQGKALINEQISEASEKHEKQLLQDLEERVKSLSQKAKEQEQIIYNYEKITPEYDEISGIVIKYRDVIDVNHQTLKLHDENSRLNYIIFKQSEQINTLKEQKEDLAQFNMKLSSEVIRAKSALITPLGRMSYIQNVKNIQPSQSSNVYAQDIIKTHKKLMKNGNSEDEFYEEEPEEEMEPLPDKIQDYITSEVYQNKPQGLVIPKLDLQKAYKIQEINAKKSTMQQLQKQQGSDMGAIYQQLKMVESDLTIAKKNLQREMLFNKVLTVENENLKRATKELEGRNQILIQAHSQYEQKWKQIFFAFCYYRDFHKKFKLQNSTNNQLFCSISSQQQTNKFSSKGHIQQNGVNSTSSQINNKSFIGLDPLNSSSFYATTLNRYSQQQNHNNSANVGNINQSFQQGQFHLHNHFNHLIGVSPQQKQFLELNNFDLNLDEEAIMKQDKAFQKELARDCLLSIAKDVYSLFTPGKEATRNSFNQNKKKNSVNLQGEMNGMRLQRSLSNPLEYMRESIKIQKFRQGNINLDRSDLCGRNFMLVGEGDKTFDQSRIEQKQSFQCRELNDVINNQEILIEFSEQTEEKGSQLYYYSPLKLTQTNKIL